MTRRRTPLLATLALAAAALAAAPAGAGPLTSSTSIGQLGTEASVSKVLTGGHAGETFVDRYAFTTNAMGRLSADLLVRSGNPKNGLDISSFSLFDADGQLLDGWPRADLWSLTFDGLAAGSYYLLVSGSMKSNAAGKYSADLAFAPISEPGNVALMAAGLGLLAMATRRRRTLPA